MCVGVCECVGGVYVCVCVVCESVCGCGCRMWAVVCVYVCVSGWCVVCVCVCESIVCMWMWIADGCVCVCEWIVRVCGVCV